MSLVCTASKRVGDREVCVDCGRTLSWLRFAFNPKKLRKEQYFQTPEGRAVLEMLDRRYPRDPRVLNWLLREYRRGRLQVSPQWLDHTRMLQHAEQHGDEYGQERANALLNDTNRPDIVLWSQNPEGGHPDPVHPGMVTGLGKLMDAGIPHSLSQDEDLKPEQRDRLPAGQGLDLMNWQYPDLLPVYNTYSERYKQRDPDAGENVHQFPNGWSMRRLTSPDEAYVEGDEMQNCIPKFAPGINNGEYHVFSLRDQQNVPHTNVLMAPRTRGGDWNGGIVRDIRAKQNLPPQEINPEYHQMVSHFLQSMNPQPTVRWDAYPPGNSPGEAGDYGLSYHPSWHELGHYATMGGPAEFFDADQYERERGIRQTSWDMDKWAWDDGFIVTANWNKVRNQMRKNNLLTPENYRKWSWLKNRFGMRPQMDANGNAVIDPETGNPSYEEHNTHLPYAEWLMREARKGGLQITMGSSDPGPYEQAIQTEQNRIAERERDMEANPEDEEGIQRFQDAIANAKYRIEDYERDLERMKRTWEDPATVHAARDPKILKDGYAVTNTVGGGTARLDSAWLDSLKTILQRRGDTGQQNNIMKLKPHELNQEVEEQKQLDRLLKHGGEVVHQFPDDWTLRRINSGEAAKLEGDIMGHCINRYASRIENGDSLNYSLRDKRGFPHVTFEIKPQKPPQVDWDKLYKQSDQLNGPAICPECGAEVDVDGRCRNGHQVKVDPFVEQYTPEQLRVFNKIMDQGGDAYTDVRNVLDEPETQQAFPDLAQQAFGRLDNLYEAYENFRKGLNTNGYSRPDPTGGHSYQIQGRGNVAPEPKYHKYIRDWLDTFPEEEKPLSVWSSYFTSKPVQYVEHLPDVDKGIDELGFKVQQGRDVDWNAITNSANNLPPTMQGSQTSKSFAPNKPDETTQYDPQRGQELFDWATSHEKAEPLYKSLTEWEKAKPKPAPGEPVQNSRGFWTRQNQERRDDPRPEIYGRCTNCEADEAWHYDYQDGYYVCNHCGQEKKYDRLEQRTPPPQPRKALPRQGPAYSPYQAAMVGHLGPQFEQYFSQQDPELYQWALHGAPDKVGFKCPNCSSSNVQPCNQCGGDDHFICGDCGAWIPAPGRQGSKTAKSTCPYIAAHKRRRKHSSIVTGKPCPCLYTHADEDGDWAFDGGGEDAASTTAHVKTADKLNDYLMNPQSRPDLQTPEAQNFLQHLQGSYHNENTDPLMPWITREWKKGRAFVPPGAATNGLVTKGLNDEWPAVSPARFNHWGDWYNSNHPSRRGVDIMQMKAPDMHQKIDEWDAAMKAEQGGGAQNRGEIIHHWPDGWTVQNLTDDKSLKDEGDKMGHCVGGYGNQVRRGSSIIHSLRDENNEPHATIELHPTELGCSMCANGDDGHVICDQEGPPSPHGAEIEQIQGKGNEAVKPEYADRLKDYFNEYYPDHDQKPKWIDQAVEDYDDLQDQDGYRTYHGDAAAMGLDEPDVDYNWRKIVDPDTVTYGGAPDAHVIVNRAEKAGQLPELINGIDDEREWHENAIKNQFDRDFRFDPADTAERYGYPPFEETDEYDRLPGWHCEACAGSGQCPECDGSGHDEDQEGKPCSKCGGEQECQVCDGYGENPDHQSQYDDAKEHYYNNIRDELKDEAWNTSDEAEWFQEVESLAENAHARRRSNSLRTAARGSHPHFSTGLLCHCNFTKHLDSKVATVKCQTCGDPMKEGAFCPRCDWGPHNHAEKQIPLDVKREQTIQAQFHSVIPESRWAF